MSVAAGRGPFGVDTSTGDVQVRRYHPPSGCGSSPRAEAPCGTAPLSLRSVVTVVLSSWWAPTAVLHGDTPARFSSAIRYYLQIDFENLKFRVTRMQ